MASLDQLSVPARLPGLSIQLSFYLWKMVVPWNLSPLYPLPPTVNPWATPFILSYGLVLASLRWLCTPPSIAWPWRRRGGDVVVPLACDRHLQNGPQIAADRYTYLASSAGRSSPALACCPAGKS